MAALGNEDQKDAPRCVACSPPVCQISGGRNMLTIFTTVFLMLNVTQAEPPDFDITTNKKEDRVVVTVADAKTVFDIHSRSGIGAADVMRTKDRWPSNVTIRLHLSGLESFAVTCGKIRLMASVASHVGHIKRLHVDQDGDDREVDKTSPFWTEIKVVGADGKPKLDYPLKDGYFEIGLPAALLRDQPQNHWQFGKDGSDGSRPG